MTNRRKFTVTARMKHSCQKLLKFSQKIYFTPLLAEAPPLEWMLRLLTVQTRFLGFCRRVSRLVADIRPSDTANNHRNKIASLAIFPLTPSSQNYRRFLEMHGVQTVVLQRRLTVGSVALYETHVIRIQDSSTNKGEKGGNEEKSEDKE